MKILLPWEKALSKLLRQTEIREKEGASFLDCLNEGINWFIDKRKEKKAESPYLFGRPGEM